MMLICADTKIREAMNNSGRGPGAVAGERGRHDGETPHGVGGNGDHVGHDAHDNGHDTGVRARLLELVRPHSHDPAAATDSALEASTEGIRAVKLSLLGLGATALAQLAIYAVSGSVALLADTVHNFSDALTAIPLWIAFRVSRRAGSDRFTYGYGRAEDLAGLFIVAMIALSAVVAAWEAVDRLLEPRPVAHVWWVAAAGVVGALGNEAVARYRIRVGRRIGSAALVADGLHARTDSLTSGAVAGGALGVGLGFPIADPVVGLGIATMILVVLRQAARDVFGRLMDSVDPALTRRVRDVAAGVDGVRSVDASRVRWIGNRLRAELDVRCDGDATLAVAHDVATTVEHALVHHVPRLRWATVHVGPTGDGHHDAIAHHDR
ncbi:MAG TPA: cation diffusion facilitator family transporter [Euzebyales bacterium]